MTLTDDQFVRGLKISKLCTKKGWKHSTEMLVASIIANANNKEMIISMIEDVISKYSEDDAIVMFNKIRHHE